MHGVPENSITGLGSADYHQTKVEYYYDDPFVETLK